MIEMKICGLGDLAAMAPFRPDYLISIVSWAMVAADIRPPWIAEDRHIAFQFDDIDSPRFAGAPTRDDIQRIVDAGRQLAAPGASTRILIHCAAGVSRSPATGFILQCIHRGPGQEQEALAATVACAVSPFVLPNTLMINYADDLLKRKGEMARVAREWNRASYWR